MTVHPLLENPDFTPSNEQWAELLSSFVRQVRWEAAMSDAGIPILAMGLSAPDMHRRAVAWDIKEGKCSPRLTVRNR